METRWEHSVQSSRKRDPVGTLAPPGVYYGSSEGATARVSELALAQYIALFSQKECNHVTLLNIYMEP